MAQLQRFAGGGFGLGGTLAARQFMDEPGQSRLKQPSVLFGAGTGALASLLYLVDVDTPLITDDFWASHAITSLPAGLFFAAFPKQAGTSTVQQVREALNSATPSRGGSASAQRATVRSKGSSTSSGRQR